MFKAILIFHRVSNELVKIGVDISEIRESSVYQEIMRMKTQYPENQIDKLKQFVDSIEENLRGLEKK
jgi:vacuolar-type H+-ATPase catalytic subunit A/Vma1